MLKTKIEKALKNVQKPARYIGNEFNSVHKDDFDNLVSFAFCFADTYEVGMSHLGMKILYHMLNDRPDCVCERVFAPWVDMEDEMRKGDIPLFSLESWKSAADFDFLGFTLQYEMSYTNIVNMLDLAGIPLKTAERQKDHPFICAGGPCAYNPEPLAEIIDFFMLGEGEELLNEVMDAYITWKGTSDDRDTFLEKLLEIEGVYVPKFYDVDYNADGTVASIVPNHPKAPPKIRKRIIKDMDRTYIPTKIIVPFMEIVHDRIMLELFRGCQRGCRFCQAGYIYRPVRQRSADCLEDAAQKLIESTGYEEMSMSSLSTSDYTHLSDLTDRLLNLTEDKKINLSLPSLRVDNFSMELMRKVQKVRKSGLTFAPEAGSQRLRDVINKNITEEDLENTAKLALGGGYTSMKLYFMIGLPTETYEDVEGIARLAYKVLDIYFAIPKEDRAKRLNITVSTSSFVPKPHTPFQWEPQDEMSELRNKQKFLKEKINRKNITYNWHQSEVSFLEAVFAKGNRKLSDVLISAQKLGCRFDGWNEHFNFEKWSNAFEENKINPDFYARRRMEYTEIMPWEHIDVGVTKEFMIRESKKAREGTVTQTCREQCSACGAECFGTC